VSRLVLLTRECNNRCIFCGQDGLPASHDDALEELALAREEGDAVTIVGGEPSLDARLPEVVTHAKALGFASIVLQTNGTGIDEPLARRLADEGLTAVHVSLHGAEARVHDYHTDNPGSFARLASAVAAARSARLRVVATTVVTRSNFRVLASIPGLLSEWGVFAWMLSFTRTAGRAAAAIDRVIPRYGLAVPYALHAMEMGARMGLRTAVTGVPSCVLGPFASRSLPEPAREFAPVCEGCDARPSCAGVDPHYLARFAADELHAVPRRPRDADLDELAPLFAGPGSLAELPPPEAALAGRERRALPVLGKVRPAIAEAPSGTVRRSGDALREILPALFVAPPEGREPEPR
jgi:hypothetical protein